MRWFPASLQTRLHHLPLSPVLRKSPAHTAHQCPPWRQNPSIPESLYFLRETLRLRQPRGVEVRAQTWEFPDPDLGQLTFSFQTVSICASGLGEGWSLLLDSLPRPREDGGGRILRSSWRARINCTLTLASDPTSTQTVQGTRSSRLV